MSKYTVVIKNPTAPISLGMPLLGGEICAAAVTDTIELCDQLLAALLLALPFVEDMADDPGYKPDAANAALKTIRAAIKEAAL